MGRPKKTEGMTPEEIEKYEQEKLEKHRMFCREYHKKHYSELKAARQEAREIARDEELGKLKQRLRVAEERWFGTPNPEPFDFQRISREDYLRCQVWLLRWMCECFDGCLLPENVRKRLEQMISACEEHLRIEDNQGYMRIIMA